MNKYRAENTFVGREQELGQLRFTLAKTMPSISVVYGRRRIGKSALIEKTLETRPALYFEGLENQGTAKQLSNF